MLNLDHRYLGVIVALMTVSIWAVFIVATRFSVSTTFTVEEVLFLRLVPSTIIMAPFMIKYDLIPRGLSWLKAFNQDKPLGIKSYLIIKGAIIIVLGTSLKNKTSSTVNVVLTENLVATMKTAQIETVIKATITPKYR